MSRPGARGTVRRLYRGHRAKACRWGSRYLTGSPLLCSFGCPSAGEVSVPRSDEDVAPGEATTAPRDRGPNANDGSPAAGDEQPNPSDHYVSVAGQPSVRFDVTGGDLPCAGQRPYWAIVGDMDHVLQTAGNGLSPTWTIQENWVAASPDAFLNAELINERRAHRQLRAPGVCPGVALNDPMDVAPIAPRRKEWADCDGSIRLWWVQAQQSYAPFGAWEPHHRKPRERWSLRTA
ncbi:MAG: hypothetical protein ACO3JL_07400 [Myxococcota bacterium]